MPPRQVWLFQFGCWTALFTAIVYLVGHIVGPPAPVNDTERQLMDLATNYRFALPGGADRSLMDVLNGFSLIFALMLATIGSAGLVVRKRGHEDAALMMGVARAFTVSSSVLLAVSLTNFFIVPTLFIAAMTTCFFCASVQAPQPESD